MSSMDAKGAVLALLMGTKAVTGYYGLPDVMANTNGIWDNILSHVDSGVRTSRLESLPDSIPVRGEYPRTRKKEPGVYVYRNGWSQDASPLGFAASTQEDTLGNSSMYNATFEVRGLEKMQVMILAANTPIVRDDLFLVIKELLYRGVSYLSDQGILGFQVTSARDGQFTQEEKPHFVHAAEINFQVFTTTTWTDRADKVRAVESSFEIVQYEDYI